MWIFSSLGRPDLIRRVVDTYQWGYESQVVLTLYERDSRLNEYLRQDWPYGWRVETVPMSGNGPTYNEMLRRYPGEPCYGFLADDAVLNTPGMLAALEAECMPDRVAYPDDGIWGDRNCTMPCIGGDLVRAVGYLSPPGIVHAAIDTVWHEIGRMLGRLRYRPDLSYTHLHPLVGRGAMDLTYQRATVASMGYEDHLRAWMHGGGLRAALERAGAA
jgi:hypothetical protein